MTNAWSLPCILVSFLPEDADIIFKSELQEYKISRKKIFETVEILKKGTFFWFKGRGLEKKIYIPIENWEISK
jgi:hypothetical protein